MPRISGIRAWLSWRLAPEIPTEIKIGGSCRQVQPEVATKIIAASTARSSHRRRPPPWARTGGSGATVWKIAHSPSRRQPLNYVHARRNESAPIKTPS